jgi:hypothetical protein
MVNPPYRKRKGFAYNKNPVRLPEIQPVVGVIERGNSAKSKA